MLKKILCKLVNKNEKGMRMRIQTNIHTYIAYAYAVGLAGRPAEKSSNPKTENATVMAKRQ